MKLGIDTAYFGHLDLDEALAHLADVGMMDVPMSAGHVNACMRKARDRFAPLLENQGKT